MHTVHAVRYGSINGRRFFVTPGCIRRTLSALTAEKAAARLDKERGCRLAIILGRGNIGACQDFRTWNAMQLELDAWRLVSLMDRGIRVTPFYPHLCTRPITRYRKGHSFAQRYASSNTSPEHRLVNSLLDCIGHRFWTRLAKKSQTAAY